MTPKSNSKPEMPHPKPDGFNAATFFAQKDRLVRFSLASALIALVVTLLSLVLVFRLTSQKPVVVGVDRAGIPFGERGTDFADAKQLHLEQALLATTALLSKGPSDFDLPEILKSLFASSALQMANELKQAEAEEFRTKQLQQKPHVARIEVLETRPDVVLVSVTGKISRVGTFRQQQFSEILPFTLQMSLKLNDDILHNRRHPTIVSEFSLKYE